MFLLPCTLQFEASLSIFSHGQETTSVNTSASHNFLLLYSHCKGNRWEGIRLGKRTPPPSAPLHKCVSGPSWAHNGPVERKAFPFDISLCSQIPSNIWKWRAVPLPHPSPSIPATWDIKNMFV